MSEYQKCVRKLKKQLEEQFERCSVYTSSTRYSSGGGGLILDITLTPFPQYDIPYVDEVYRAALRIIETWPEEVFPFHFDFDVIVRDCFGYMRREVSPGSDVAYKTELKRNE